MSKCCIWNFCGWFVPSFYSLFSVVALRFNIFKKIKKRRGKKKKARSQSLISGLARLATATSRLVALKFLRQTAGSCLSDWNAIDQRNVVNIIKIIICLHWLGSYTKNESFSFHFIFYLSRSSPPRQKRIGSKISPNKGIGHGFT